MSRRTSLFLASIWLLTGLVAFGASEPEVLFAEHFDALPNGSALPAPWAVSGGQATVEDGRLHIISEKQNPRVTLKRSFSGDISFSARFIGATKMHWCGLAFRDKYYLTVNHQFWTFSLRKTNPYVADGSGALAERPGYGHYVYRLADFTIRVDIRGKRIQGYIDDKLLVEATDPELPDEGTIGFVGGWGTDLLVDDVIVRRPPPEPHPAPDPHFELFEGMDAHIDRPDGIYHDGETVPVTVEWVGDRVEPVPLRFTLLDYYERPVQQWETEWVPGARLTLTAKPDRRGIFKLAVRGTIAGQPARTDLISFAVLNPELAGRPVEPDSPFGIHPHWEAPEFHYALARKLGARWARDHDTIQYTWWPYVESEPDKWRWYDDGLALLARNNLSLLGEFLYTPAWAADVPDGTEVGGHRFASGAYPPKNWEDFADYVYHTVDHYKDRIHVWEVWNEPSYHGFWKGTPEQYVKLLQVAFTAAKRADPNCTILGGGGIFITQPEWNERAFAAGLLKWCDKVSIHGYVDAIHPMDAQEMEGHLAAFRELMRKHGGEKPIWSTENTIMSTSFLDPLRRGYEDADMPYHFRQAANNMVRLYVTSLANGFEKIFYYYASRPKSVAQVLDNPVNGCLLEPHGCVKPMGVAYATTADLLDGARPVGRIALDPRVRVYLFERNGQQIAVTWGLFGGRDAKLKLRLVAGGAAEQLRVVDILDNSRPVERRGDRVFIPFSKEPVFVCARMSEDAFRRMWHEAKVMGRLPDVSL